MRSCIFRKGQSKAERFKLTLMRVAPYKVGGGAISAEFALGTPRWGQSAATRMPRSSQR
jgi:hypothetical protein